MEIGLDVRMDRDPLDARETLRIVRAVLDHAVEPPAPALIEIAVGEVLANAIQHGQPAEQPDSIRVKLSLLDDRLTVDLLDQGEPFDPRLFSRPDVSPDQRDSLPTGGMGLALAHDAVDVVAYDFVDGVNTIRLEQTVVLQRGSSQSKRMPAGGSSRE